MKNWGKGPALMSSMWWLSLLMTELPSKRITKGPGHPQRLPQDTRKVTTMKPSPLISLGLSWIHNSLFFSFWVFPGCKAGNELAELVVRPLLQMKAAAAAAVRWLSANTRSLKKEAVAKVRVVDFLSVFLDLARRLWGGYYKQKQESLGNPRLLFTF